MRKSILFVLVSLLLVGAVSAFVDVPYSFNEKNVDVVAVDCLNSDCSSARAFSGSFPDGSSTTDGSLTVRYPSSLASSFGYGLIYLSHGFLPKGYKASWNNNGHDDILSSQPFSIDFGRKPSCRAQVDNFEVLNVAKPNIPLVISFDASLDADVHSAFSLTKSLAYIPDDKKQEFYGVDTLVHLKILSEGGQLVHSEDVSLTASVKRALLVDSSQRVEFSWTPKIVGKYTVILSTDVVDDQCTAKEFVVVSKDLSVLGGEPKNACYTLLNSVDFSKKEFVEGEKASFSFTSLSVRADDSGSRVSLPSDVSYEMKSPNGKIVSTVLSVGASSGFVRSVVEFLALERGVYSVRLSGSPHGGSGSSSCDGLSVLSESLSNSVLVVKDQKFDVRFQIVDAMPGAHVAGGKVVISGKSLLTSDNGRTVISDLSSGKYSYVVSKNGYDSLFGTVSVDDFDRDLFLSLVPSDGVGTAVRAPVVPDRAFSDIFIDSANTMNEFSLSAGSSMNTNVVLSNRGSKDASVKVVAYSLTLPAISSSKSVVVSANSVSSVSLSWNVPSSSRDGKHWYAVVVWNDDASVKAHRFVVLG